MTWSMLWGEAIQWKDSAKKKNEFKNVYQYEFTWKSRKKIHKMLKYLYYFKFEKSVNQISFQKFTYFTNVKY